MKNKIKCPNCGHSFDVEEALAGELEAHIKAEYEKKIAEQAEKFNADKKQLSEDRVKFNAEKTKQDELVKEKLAEAIEKEKVKIEKSTQENYEVQLKSLKEENEQRKAENKTLKEKEVALMRQEADLKEKQEDLNLTMEKELLVRKNEIEEKARAKEREAMSLKEMEYQKQLAEQKKLIEEMKRKAEQGSMQLQGEVQELAIEELLGKAYPFDKINEVLKGIRGADSIQTVINSSQQECGSIVYESKRTKSFSNGWIDKLKQDQVSCKADIAVLVTETMPNDMKRFGEKDGVWICGFHEVKSLSFVLRELLIKTHSIKLSQENKGDKMELLYNYLTSNEFVQNINRIVENYDNMLLQLNTEKKSMQKIWSMREKQIGVVQENLSVLFGSIKGIAGNALETIEILQIPNTNVEQ